MQEKINSAPVFIRRIPNFLFKKTGPLKYALGKGLDSGLTINEIKEVIALEVTHFFNVSFILTHTTIPETKVTIPAICTAQTIPSRFATMPAISAPTA